MNTGDNLIQTWISSRNSVCKFYYFWSLQLDLQGSNSGPNSVRNLSVCEWLLLNIRHTLQYLAEGGLKYLKCLVSLEKNVHCRPLLAHLICAPNSLDLQFPPRGVLDLAAVWDRILTEMIGTRSGPKKWFKPYVKNSKELVFSVQLLKEITTCFSVTL